MNGVGYPTGGETCDVDVRPSEIDRVADRLSALWCAIEDARGIAGTTADRIFGPQPCVDCSSAKQNNANSGSLGRVNEMCSSIETAITTLTVELRRLERV